MTSVVGAALTGNKESIFQQLQNGIPMPFYSLKLLTLFPPTGMLGMNHAALGNQAMAIIKAGSAVILVILVTLLLPYYPRVLHKGIIWLSYFGPWFMFDILEVFSVGFNKHAFRMPLNIVIEGLTKEGPTTGAWKLTTPMATGITTALAASGVLIANLLPPSLVPASMSSNIALIAGGTGATLGLATVALMMFSAPAPTAAPTLTSVVPQRGGGTTSLPPLSSFADKLIQAKSPDESLAFLATIALIIFGGITTASLR
jgi:hypothetical protein